MTSKYAALPGYFKAYPSFSAGPIDGRTNEHLQFTGFSSWTDIASTIPADSKLLILARHGEGYHNAANAFYGDQAWDDYWSLLDGDGNTTWLDAQLTQKGIQQTLDAGKNILTPLFSELGLPDIFYVSPLRRCIETFIHEWSTVLDASGFSYKGENVTVNVREALRETIGEHTCDKRLNHSTVYNTYQGSPLYDAVLNLEYEPCYPEQDAVWTSTERETDSEMDTRFAKILDQILDRPERYISVTYHSGAIESTLRALSHPHVKHLPTAGFVFVVVGPRWRVQPALRPLPQQSNSSS